MRRTGSSLRTSRGTPEPRSAGPLSPIATASGPLITPMPLVRSSQMRLWVSSSSVLDDLRVHDLAELEDLLVPAGRNLQRQPANPHRVVGEPRAAVLLEQVEDQLALAERIEEHRHRADVHRVGAQPEAVAGNPLELAENRPHVARAARHLDRHQLLDRLAVADVVGRGRHVVHPVGQQDDLRPVAVLAQFLDAAVEVADHDLGVDDLLAIEPQHDPQHAVRARMLRPHVDHQLVGVEHRAVVDGGGSHLNPAESAVRSPSANVRTFVGVPRTSNDCYSISASSFAWRSFSQSSGFSMRSSPGPSRG